VASRHDGMPRTESAEMSDERLQTMKTSYVDDDQIRRTMSKVGLTPLNYYFNNNLFLKLLITIIYFLNY
jgi:hypothetical protein